MHNQRILITGGAGFVGSHIIELLLLDNPKEIIVLDNLIRGNIKNLPSSSKITFINGDICDKPLLDTLFKDIDYCFHMAALRITRCAENPEDAFNVMYQGTFNVLQACVKHQVKKLVAASSASIYGTADQFPTPETHHPYHNHTLYGAAKMANELMYRSYKDMFDLDYVAFRFFNVYGTRMDVEGKYTEVLIRWYRLLKDGKQPLIFGDGSQSMDFVCVTDIARACIAGLRSNVTDEVFNVGTGIETSLKDLCYLLIDVMGVDIQPKFVPLPQERQKVEVARRRADTSKAKELLSFESTVQLKAGLTHLVKWLESLSS